MVFFSAMENFTDDQTKKPRKRQMSRAKRVLANRRERERVRKMNDAFEELRSAIPNYEETRVKTKLELLRIATNYIQSLKDHIQNSVHVHEGYNSSMNPLMYPSAFEMENGGPPRSAPRMSDYPFPPQFPVPPPPPAFTELSNLQFSQQQTIPAPVSNGSAPDSSNQDFCNLLTSSLADSHVGENFLYNLQVKNKNKRITVHHQKQIAVRRDFYQRSIYSPIQYLLSLQTQWLITSLRQGLFLNS